MGADRGRDPMALDNERWSPAQAEGSVVLPEFLISRHEVTVAEFSDVRAVAHVDRGSAGVIGAARSSRHLRVLARRDRVLPLAPDAAPGAAARLARHAADRSAVGEGGSWIRSPPFSVGR